MPADPDDIIRATRAAQVVTLADASLKAQLPTARDAVTTPDPGYFVNPADAAAALATKARLLGVPRSRWIVDLVDELEIDPVIGIPTMLLRDSVLAVNTLVLPMRVQLSLEDERTALEVIG